MSRVAGRASAFGSHTVQVDPWGTNPGADDLAQTDPEGFKAAKAKAPVPTLFASGDLPPFTASGVPPEHLLRLPFEVRHAAASELSPATVLALIETYGDDPDGFVQAGGLDAYTARLRNWLAAGEDDEDFYARLFPGTNR